MWDVIGRLAKYVSATLVVAQFVELAYLAPGSLGQDETGFDGFTLALIVLTINRLVWRRLYTLASTRYRLES